HSRGVRQAIAIDLFSNLIAGHVDRTNTLAVVDIVKRVPVIDDEIGPLPLLDRASILDLESAGRTARSRHEYIFRGHSRLRHHLHFQMLEVPLKARSHGPRVG